MKLPFLLLYLFISGFYANAQSNLPPLGKSNIKNQLEPRVHNSVERNLKSSTVDQYLWQKNYAAKNAFAGFWNTRLINTLLLKIRNNYPFSVMKYIFA